MIDKIEKVDIMKERSDSSPVYAIASTSRQDGAFSDLKSVN
jgi:hypothetical protein